MIGGRKVDPRRVAILIDGLMLPPNGRLFRELQVRSLQLSPLVTTTNLKPAEIMKRLPPLPTTFDQILTAMKNDRPIGNLPSVKELREVGLGEALERFLRALPEDDRTPDGTRNERFFQQIRPDEFSKAVEPMRSQVGKISVALVNELSNEEWLSALASSPARANVLSFDSLQALIALRADRRDQLLAYLAASYREPGSPAIQFARKFATAASSFLSQRAANSLVLPGDIAKSIARKDDEIPYFVEAISVGADFLNGNRPMDKKAYGAISRALSSGYYDAKAVVSRSAKTPGGRYRESLGEEGAAKLNEFETAFTQTLAQSLDTRHPVEPYLVPLQAVAEAVWMSGNLCAALDTTDPSLFAIPGALPGIGLPEGASKEMLDRFFRVAVHTWSNAKEGWSTEIGSDNFKIFLTEVGAISCMKTRFPDRTAVEKAARQVLGTPELADRKFFKNSIVSDVMYIREGIEPPIDFWNIKPKVERPTVIIQPGSTRHMVPQRGKPGNGYPPRELPPPK